VKGIAVHWGGLCLQIVELLQHGWQQNSLFIVEALFLQKQSGDSLTNSTTTLELQLLNLWLLQTTLKGEKDGVIIIKLGVWWLQICNMVRWVTLHVVPNIRPGLCVEKHGGGSVIFWAAISCYYAGPLITLNGRITASDYMGIWGNQVLPAVQMFPDNDTIFQGDISPIHTDRNVKSWFQEQENALQRLPWPAQSLDLNIIESMWSVLERRVRSRFPSSPVKQLDDVVHEDWYSIPLQTIEYLVSLFQEGCTYYRQMVARLCINKEMCTLHNFCPSSVRLDLS
jgi:hypothetical protein